MSRHVRIVPANIDLSVEDGETVMQAAKRAGWQWPTVCHGEGECSTCWFETIEGIEHLDEASPRELATLDLIGFVRSRPPGFIRLACQATTSGDLVIKKRGVKPT